MLQQNDIQIALFLSKNVSNMTKHDFKQDPVSIKLDIYLSFYLVFTYQFSQNIIKIISVYCCPLYMSK